jgi:hypothetical protein
LIRSNAQKIRPVNDSSLNKSDIPKFNENDLNTTRGGRSGQNDSLLQTKGFDGDITLRLNTEENDSLIVEKTEKKLED